MAETAYGHAKATAEKLGGKISDTARARGLTSEIRLLSSLDRAPCG